MLELLWCLVQLVFCVMSFYGMHRLVRWYDNLDTDTDEYRGGYYIFDIVDIFDREAWKYWGLCIKRAFVSK